MKAYALTGGAAALGVVISLILAADVAVRIADYRELRRTQQEILQRMPAEEATLPRPSDSSSGTEDWEAQLTAKDAQIAALEAKLETLRQEIEEADATKPAAAAAQAFQVKTYLGNDYIGKGWVYTENQTKDPKTGQTVFEPALRLPNTLKRHFVVYQTNIVQREIAAASPQYTQNYYGYNGAFYPFGVHFVGTTPRGNTPSPPRPGSTFRFNNTKPLIGRGTAAPWAKPF